MTFGDAEWNPRLYPWRGECAPCARGCGDPLRHMCDEGDVRPVRAGMRNSDGFHRLFFARAARAGGLPTWRPTLVEGPDP